MPIASFDEQFPKLVTNDYFHLLDFIQSCLASTQKEKTYPGTLSLEQTNIPVVHNFFSPMSESIHAWTVSEYNRKQAKICYEASFGSEQIPLSNIKVYLSTYLSIRLI